MAGLGWAVLIGAISARVGGIPVSLMNSWIMSRICDCLGVSSRI
jgi:hypothetical protein